MKSWIAEIEKYVDEKTIKFVVGNKNDLEEKRQVTHEEAINFSIKSFLFSELVGDYV